MDREHPQPPEDKDQESSNIQEKTESSDAIVPKPTNDSSDNHYAKFKKNKKKNELPFDVEGWYNKISKYTFETVFVPMTLEEGKVLVKNYRIKELHHKMELTDEDKALLEAIHKKLSDSVQKCKGRDDAVFFRLSARSPKDSVLWGSQQFIDLLARELTKLGDRKTELNEQAIAVFYTMGEILKVRSGDDAMYQLTHSERAYMDLLESVEYADEFQVNYIFRKWTDIHPAMEFRGFVYNRKLNALSQYNDMVFFKSLLEQKDAIAEKVQKFWASIADDFPFEHCVVDFGVLNDRVVIIELNPFNDYEGAGTGGALFHWKGDADVLKNGPFEFRILTEIPERQENKISPDIRVFIDQALEKSKKDAESSCSLQ